MALQLKKFSYKALKGMTVQDRLAAAQDREMGQWLMSLLTPSQFVDLFPDYYRKRMPDIGGFMAAMPTSMSRAKQAAIEEQLNNTVSGDKAGSNYKAGGWRKKYQDGVDRERATISRKGTVPAPQLSPEQRKIFDDLKNAPLSSDDPRAKMFANLSEEQLSQVGISKTKDKTGKEVFQYAAPNISDEAAKKSLSKSEQARSIETVANRLGIAPKDLAAVMHYESAGSMSTSKWGGTGGNYLGLIQFGPAERRQFGVYAGQPFDEQCDAAGKFLEQRGLRRWLANHPNASQEEKRIALYSTINAGSPDEKNWYKSDNGGRDNVITHTRRIFSEHYGAAEKFMGQEGPYGGDYSQKSIELAKERLTREQEETRVGNLAKWTSADMPTTPSGVGASTGSWLGESKQCVALSKHFAPNIGPASGWKVHNNPSGIQPGAVIATMSYNDGSGGKMARDMPDGKSHYHTGIALTVPDANGNVLILDQHAGRGASIKSVNINDYHGEKWGVVAGGEPSESTMRALDMAKSLASEEQKAFINGQIKVQQVAAVSKVAPAAEKDVKEGSDKKNVRQDPTPPVPKAGPQGDPSVESKRNPAVVPQDNKAPEKKPEVKPEEKKPVDTKPPIPSPANPAPQVRTPEVRKNAYGGDNRVNTDQIKGYHLGGDGENVLVTNKNQKPLFTMNTNESITMNPLNDTATVTPKNKNNTIKSNSDNPMQGRLNDMQDSIKELSSRFETNKTMPEPQERHDPHPPEGGAWLNNLNKLTEHVFHSPATRRAFYRAQGQEADNGTGTNHYNHGNRS